MIVLQVVDGNDWAREIPLTSRITTIGGHDPSHVRLDPTLGVCAQLIDASPEPVSAAVPRAFQLVNLMDKADIEIGIATVQRVAPHTSVTIGCDMPFKIGAFTLKLKQEIARNGKPHAYQARAALNFGVDVLLVPGTTLRWMDPPTRCRVTIHNRGAERAEFGVELLGLPDDCIRMLASPPILAPTDRQEVEFALLHPRGPALLSGDHEIAIQVKAPLAYPFDVAVVPTTLHVPEYYAHELGIMPSEA